MIKWIFGILVIGIGFCFVAPVSADELRPGYIEFTQSTSSDWTYLWKAPLKGGITPETKPILPKSCAFARAPSHAIEAAMLLTRATVHCTAPVAGETIGLSGFGSAQTDVLVRVAPMGRPLQVLRLTAAAPEAIIRAKPDRLSVARTYFATGVLHILYGYDHLLFVISLVLLLNGFRTIAMAVTAFTLAHSITLIGTTLGMFGLPQAPVECLIALSIIFLAVEIVKAQSGAALRLSQRVPWVVAFLFGLLHGFGFAGALKEIGLPESDIPTALLTFNLGVEAGQMMIVLATLALLALLHRFAASYAARAIRVASYAIGITAGYWFIDRLIM